MLNQKTVSVKTVNGFKSKLEEERSKRMGLFMDRSLLVLEAVLSMVGTAGPVSTCEYNVQNAFRMPYECSSLELYSAAIPGAF